MAQRRALLLYSTGGALILGALYLRGEDATETLGNVLFVAGGLVVILTAAMRLSADRTRRSLIPGYLLAAALLLAVVGGLSMVFGVLAEAMSHNLGAPLDPAFGTGSITLVCAAATSLGAAWTARRLLSEAGRRWVVPVAALLSIVTGAVGLWGLYMLLIESARL